MWGRGNGVVLSSHKRLYGRHMCQSPVSKLSDKRLYGRHASQSPVKLNTQDSISLRRDLPTTSCAGGATSEVSDFGCQPSQARLDMSSAALCTNLKKNELKPSNLNARCVKIQTCLAHSHSRLPTNSHSTTIMNSVPDHAIQEAVSSVGVAQAANDSPLNDVLRIPRDTSPPHLSNGGTVHGAGGCSLKREDVQQRTDANSLGALPSIAEERSPNLCTYERDFVRHTVRRKLDLESPPPARGPGTCMQANASTPSPTHGRVPTQLVSSRDAQPTLTPMPMPRTKPRESFPQRNPQAQPTMPVSPLLQHSTPPRAPRANGGGGAQGFVLRRVSQFDSLSPKPNKISNVISSFERQHRERRLHEVTSGPSPILRVSRGGSTSLVGRTAKTVSLTTSGDPASRPALLFHQKAIRSGSGTSTSGCVGAVRGSASETVRILSQTPTTSTSSNTAPRSAAVSASRHARSHSVPLPGSALANTTFAKLNGETISQVSRTHSHERASAPTTTSHDAVRSYHQERDRKHAQKSGALAVANWPAVADAKIRAAPEIKRRHKPVDTHSARSRSPREQRNSKKQTKHEIVYKPLPKKRPSFLARMCMPICGGKAPPTSPPSVLVAATPSSADVRKRRTGLWPKRAATNSSDSDSPVSSNVTSSTLSLSMSPSAPVSSSKARPNVSSTSHEEDESPSTPPARSAPAAPTSPSCSAGGRRHNENEVKGYAAPKPCAHVDSKSVDGDSDTAASSATVGSAPETKSQGRTSTEQPKRGSVFDAANVDAALLERHALYPLPFLCLVYEVM